jgi:cysteine desulfurase
MSAIYLDCNATTPVHPGVLEAMLPFLRDGYGNPSLAYELGRRAKEAVENARAEVAALIGAAADEIVFTSCATESTNMAIRGVARIDPARNAIVTSTIEHPATESCCTMLERDGHPVRRVPCGADGLLDPEMIAEAIGDTIGLVTIIHAQNEIGTVQPVAAIADAARRRGAVVHADAAQSVGKIPVNVDALKVDLLTIAGHKLYAPKGIGALYVRRGVKLPSLLYGAGQESGRRPGTENVPYMVALGEACRLAAIHLGDGRRRVDEVTKHLLARLRYAVPGLVLVGHADARLPNTLNVLFPGVSGRRVLEACPEVAASTGSACHADSEEPSAILTALGLSRDQALGAVRLSVGRDTTTADVERAASSLAAAWRTIHQSNPVAAE